MRYLRTINRITTQLTFAIALFLLAACAGPQLKIEPVSVTDNPTEAISILETDLAAAVQEQLNVLSPDWYAKAERSLAEAKTILSKGGELEEIGQSVSRGHAELKQAKEYARKARITIPDAIKARDMARTAGATSFGREYTKIEENFLGLTRKIQDDNLSYAKKNQKKVADLFHAIELKAIKKHTLGEVRDLIREAESAGASKTTPKMLKEVKAELMAVDSFITANPYAKEEMRVRAASSRFNASRLVQIVKQTKAFDDMKPVQISLWEENMLKSASEKLGAADMRDRDFETQRANVLESIASLVTDRNFLAEQVKTQKAAIAEMKEKHPTEVAQLGAQHDAERAALQKRHDKEIAILEKKVASLEGKSRAEAEKLEKLMAEKRAERERLEAEKRAEQTRLEAERRAVEAKLAAERRFARQYQDASGLFSPDEAECYKQGQQMVIRLKSMNFPVGQSVIMPDNYPLLSKMQLAVRIFGEPGIVIEGHSDSTGSPETNNLLSQQRAEAVRHYLLANAGVKEEEIVAAGFGATRPLAPNTTAKGRAINRRIDVVITPAQMTSP